MPMNESYYRKSPISGTATKISIGARNKIVDLFFELFPPTKFLSVLDLGVSSENDPTANVLEKRYPYPEKLVCAGLQDASWLEKAHPGIQFIQIDPGKALPFQDQEFDVVYSNAVVEHTGSRREQALFLSEAVRVSRAFFITTPNRWFPVETHTHVPLLHYLPQKWFRFLLRWMKEDFYSKEKNFNLLSRKDFFVIFPAGVSVTARFIWTVGFPSNIVAHGLNRPVRRI